MPAGPEDFRRQIHELHANGGMVTRSGRFTGEELGRMSSSQADPADSGSPVADDAPLVPARMVNEFVYCPRLAYLMWAQAEWTETSDTVDGRRVHVRVDRANAPLPSPGSWKPGQRR